MVQTHRLCPPVASASGNTAPPPPYSRSCPYAAEAGNNWRFCLDWKNIPRGTSAGLPTTYQNIPDEYLNTPVAKGRYLRFLVTDSYRPGANTIQLGELYVRKLLSVDGYTAQ